MFDAFDNPLALLGLLALVPLGVWDVLRRWEARRAWQIGATALRLAMLALVVVALAEPRFTVPDRATDVVFLVDRSASIPDARLATALQEVQTQYAALPRRTRAGLVLFDGRAEVLVAPGEPWSLPETPRGEPVQQTDLAAAVRTGLGLVEPAAPARLVLFTDARPTTSGLDEALAAARAQGIPIEVVPVDPAREVSGLAAVELDPPEVRPGQTVKGRVFAEGGDLPEQGRVVVRLGDEVIHTEEVSLPAHGSVEVAFEHALDPEREPGVVDVTTSLEVGGEVRTTTGALVIGRRPRVWVIADDHRDVRHLMFALKAESMDVERIGARGLVGRADELEGVDLVILGNVPLVQREGGAPAVPRVFGEAIRRYVSAGGGLITLGGDKAYELGGWGTSPIASVLPVELNPMAAEIDPSVAMVIILDKSGSMNERASDGKTKMQLADEGAVASLSLLRSFDQIGVMAVDDRVEWTVPMQDVADKRRLGSRIMGVRAGGGGIYVYTSLVAARQALAKLPNPLKHVILFSDARDSEEKVQGIPFGWGVGPNCYELAGRMKEEGITTSVIGVGRRHDQDSEFLELLAETGGGRFYLTNDATELRSLFVEETQQLVDSSVHEKAFKVRVARPHPVLDDIDFDRAPRLDGYLEVEPRDTAEVLLTGPNGDPILTTWQYGLGQVASLATDAGPRWSSSWLPWSGYAKLWTQLARWSLRRDEGGTTALEVGWDGSEAEIKVARRTLEGLAREEAVRGELLEIDAQGSVIQQQPLRLEAVEPGLWKARVPTQPQHRYVVRIGGEADDDPVLAERTVVAPASLELRHRSLDVDALAHVAEATGGVVHGRGPAPELRRAGVGDRSPLWWWFALAAVLLMPIDAFLRRPARVL